MGSSPNPYFTRFTRTRSGVLILCLGAHPQNCQRPKVKNELILLCSSLKRVFMRMRWGKEVFWLYQNRVLQWLSISQDSRPGPQSDCPLGRVKDKFVTFAMGSYKMRKQHARRIRHTQINFTPSRWDAVKENARLWWKGELKRPLMLFHITDGQPRTRALQISLPAFYLVP